MRWTASVEPREVTVGDPFLSGVAVSVPAGTRVELELPADSADRWRVLAAPRAAPRDSARSRWLLVVRAVAWQPGLSAVARGTLRLTAARGETRRVAVTLALPRVRAVLPDDSTRWVVRPPHDVWGSSGLPPAARAWPWLLLALLAALLAWLGTRRLRRRRGTLPASARERALALLERAERSGWIEAGNWKAFYTLLAEALRALAEAMEPGWGADLSSAELLASLRAAGVAGDAVLTLEALLGEADLAKFARAGSTPEQARAALAAARGWVRGFSGAPPAAAASPVSAGAVA